MDHDHDHDHSSGASGGSCFWGVYPQSFPDHELNFYSKEFFEGASDQHHEFEYVDAITALFITGMGFYQLSWDHPYGIIRLLGGCFFVNGIAAFLNHTYNTREWYIIDNASMYIPAWVLLAAITGHLHAVSLDYNNTLPNNRVIRPFIKGLVWGIVCVVIFFLLYTDMNGCEWGPLYNLIFSLGFTLPPIILTIECTIFVGYAFEIINARYLQSNNYYGHRFEQSVVYLTWGIGLTFIGAGLNFMNGILVYNDVAMPFIPFHALWHILKSYGLSLIMVFFVSLTALRDQMRIDARFDTVRSESNRSPDFALKTGKNRVISTRCCCYCCPLLQSRRFDGCLNVVFPIPTKLYYKGFKYSKVSKDSKYVTKKGGFCRCWMHCVEVAPCCCDVHHYEVPNDSVSRQDSRDLIVSVTDQDDEKRGLIDDNL